MNEILTRILKCRKCNRDISFEILDMNSAGINGIVTCRNCMQQWAVIDSVLIDTRGFLNEQKLQEFNARHNTNIALDLIDDTYSTFVMEGIATKGNEFTSFIKKVASFCYYSIVLLTLSVYLFFSGSNRKSPLSDKNIEGLCGHYWHVPEMAIFKSIELTTILEELPQRDIGVFCDFGGGDGFITSLILDSKSVRYRMNVDLFANPSPLYDIQLSQNILKSSISKDTIDTLISVCVMEHVPAALTILPAICDKIKPDGRLLFTMPKPEYSKSLLLRRIADKFSTKWANRYEEIDHARAFHVSLHPESEVVNALKTAGFATVKTIPFLSPRQLMFYDAINLPSKLSANWHFWGELYQIGERHRWVKRIMTTITRFIIKRYTSLSTSDGNTHVLYSCVK